jgi:hypothetical protein
MLKRITPQSFLEFQNNETTANLATKPYLTRPFHHDRGRIVFAVSPRRGEQGALGRPSGRDMYFRFKILDQSHE